MKTSLLLQEKKKIEVWVQNYLKCNRTKQSICAKK